MEDWQIEALARLVSDDYHSEHTSSRMKEVDNGRVYLASSYYGDDLYHVVSLRNDGDVAIDQIDQREKYQQRVVLESAEVEPLLVTLLRWHLEMRAPRPEVVALISDADDSLGDLDDHPF